jgi:hypothetical protein|tara:strand:- start:100 stop:351 length:252 start_codon:yes stop_codon:yes gene_type:complete
MTLVKMLQTRMGSEDGHVVKRFVKGEQYDITEGEARHFFRLGWAERGVETVEDLTKPLENLKPLPVFDAVELPTDEELENGNR